MKPFNVLFANERTRQSQRDVAPATIKNSLLAADVVKDTTAVEEDAVSLSNGAQLNVTSTVASNINSEVRLGICPFMIAFFETSKTVANHIPFGTNVDNDAYRVVGPLAVPELTIVGHDGFNAVFKTAIYNNTGGSKDIIIVTQARFIAGGGGEAS